MISRENWIELWPATDYFDTFQSTREREEEIVAFYNAFIVEFISNVYIISATQLESKQADKV